jgi:4-amino-4-deoxychorismate lyase
MTEISFTEAIRMEDGKLHNLNYHQKRIDATLRRFWHNEHNDISLQSALSHIMPQDGICKIHIEYNGEGISEITQSEYKIRDIRSLRLVNADDAEYSYKYADRSALMKLQQSRQDSDEVIIVRNGCLTDTSYSNIALHNKHGWFTPDKPLLPGTMRRSLIDQGLLSATEITLGNLNDYDTICLINAMMPLGRLVLPISAIKI